MASPEQARYYPEPFPKVATTEGLLAFWPEKPGVTLKVNGQAV